ncbi:MAG: DUF2955 domain-containing protein [Gammaproteobacteria bacterium]|nr:DUF2955 domain-containing protein [Gammaproteobacteria bacterium]
MPIEVTWSTASGTRSPLANARILRLAFGTALSLWISQAVGWSISYMAPVLTMFLLALPMPRPKLRFIFVVVMALAVSVYGTFIFLPLLLHQKAAGFLLLSLALFHSFYFTARGGKAVIGTLVTVGLALTVAVGTVSVDALLAVAQGLMFGAAVGTSVAVLSHVLIRDPAPDPSAELQRAAQPEDAMTIDNATAAHNALRSLAIVAPIILWFLLSGNSAANMAVMIKVAGMGQEVSKKNTRDAAKSLIISTFAGGVAAVIAWQVLSIWPSLTLYVLLIGLAGLIFGQRIFEGGGLRHDAATWSYAFLTLIVVLAPAVLDTNSGSSADARFYDRLLMFVWATLYGVGAVYVFDAFWPRNKQ